MVANRGRPRQGTITDLITGLLDRGYARDAQPVLDAIARSTNSGLVAQRLRELDAEAARLDQAGERLTADNPILRAVLADLDDALHAAARRIANAADPLQANAARAAGTIQRQLALPGITDTQLARIGLRWNSPNPEAIARLVAYAQSDAWAAQLRQYERAVLDIVRNQAIQGGAFGWNPLRTAREIRRTAEALPAHQANTLMRTLQLTSYRDAAAAHQQANIAIAEQVIRVGTLDDRTCLACIAQHGLVIWDSERDVGAPIPRVNDHYSGRCTSVIVVKGRPVRVTTGPQWFAALPPARQAQQAAFASSPGKYAAFEQGRVTLADFVSPYTDPLFGPMLREAGLAQALNR
ncbi:MAG: hypothetical protein BroJett033_7980 [Chloroflexota bacterium]|nr:MAG: hypothetical protein BroJett033_7980 [Chloroflexota bacterium]